MQLMWQKQRLAKVLYFHEAVARFVTKQYDVNAFTLAALEKLCGKTLNLILSP